MFSSYETVKKTVTITLDGKSQKVPAGVSVAAAVLGTGKTHTRTSPVSGEPRAPFCMMGVCYECLMEIDGHKDQQSCQIQIKEGMVITRQTRVNREEK
jgi:D-hydroxyproline dehydrogenase subunit gamma